MAENFIYFSNLPDDTLIFDGHEYTMHNLKWSASMEPERHDVYKKYIKSL